MFNDQLIRVLDVVAEIIPDFKPNVAVQVNGGIINYLENQSNRSVLITPNLILSDVDSLFLSRALIRFSITPPDGESEVLMLSNPFPGLALLQINKHQISISGIATLSTYQSLLRNLLYAHNITSGDPTAGARDVEIYVTDDLNSTSIADLVTITLTPINDAPVVDLNGLEPGRDYFVTYRESSGNISILPFNISILDADNVELTEVIITLTNPQNESEFISLSPSSSLLVTQSPHRITISSFSSTPDLFIDTLRTLTYSNSEEEPKDLIRVISVSASDGLLISELSFIYIYISLVNDAPILDLDSSTSSNDYTTTFVENQPAVMISLQPVIIDPDSKYISELRIQYGDIRDLSLISIYPKLNCNDSSPHCSIYFSPFTSLSTVSSLISNITFFDPALEPISTTRVFYLSVFDGFAWSSSAISQVTIQSVNDNLPLFVNTPYDFNIEENMLNLFVFTAEATDVDSQNSIFTLIYSIKNCPEQCPFIINNTTGDVYTSSTIVIDRELISYYLLTLEVTDGLFTSTTSLFVNITDQNDNCPSFLPDTYNYTLPLQTLSGASLITILAIDPDESPNGTSSIRFEILQVFPYLTNVTIFEINPDTGILYLVADEDSLDPFISYMLVIGATGPSCSVTDSDNNASVTINLIQNTMAPTFLQDPIFCIFPEGVILGNCIVVASDDDIGIYGSFIYSLIDNSSTFSITDTSGVVTVRNDAILDFEVRNSYTLTVVAVDNGRPSMTSSAQLIVNVTDENDNIPIFSLTNYTAVVCENTPLNTTILQVEASDRDSGSFGEVQYYITPSHVPFSISPISGIIWLSGTIDFENVNTYSVNVSAVDGGMNRMVVPVNIQILNDNDNEPTFMLPFYQTTLPENATIGTPLLLPSVLATDADTCNIDQCLVGGIIRTELIAACQTSDNNGTLTFSILPSSESNFFSINSETGVITLAMMIDFEKLAVHMITIQASDGIFETSALILINVNDTNDNAPTFLQSNYSSNVLEGTAIGTSVLQVIAQDLDLGGNSAITLILQGVFNSFVIDDDGIIYTNIDIDFEKTKEFDFTVMAIDMGLPHMIGTAEVIISVLDVNDNAPVFSRSLYTASIFENLDKGSLVTIVDAVDLDSGTNAKLSYSIEGDTPFLINSTTGYIFLESSIDYEDVIEYSFLVMVTDQGDTILADFAQVNISILDINDNAISFNQTEINITLIENAPPSNLLQLFATDNDSVQITDMFFSLTNSSSLPFSITSVGTLRNTQPIDFETDSFFSLQVKVYDDGPFQGFSDTTLINVRVMDQNDNSPVFDRSSYETQIEEHSDIATPVITVLATDVDLGVNGIVEYQITGVHPPLGQSAFAIDSILGMITVNSNVDLDRERFSAIILQVTAFNPHFPYQYSRNSTVNVLIILTDINDNPPTFLNTPYLFFISEDFTPINTNTSLIGLVPRLIGRVEAIDQDLGNNSLINFNLINTGYSLFFRLNSTTGEIYTNSVLDRESTIEYTLYVSATDGGVPTLMNMIEVKIDVTDLNDNIPMFPEGIIRIRLSENTSIGMLVYNFSTTDPDIGENSNLSYSLISNTNATIPFIVNSYLGTLYVSSELDRESAASYSFLIQVNDNGVPSFSSTSNVEVEILDENDNAPIIQTNLSTTIRILESAPIGVFVSAVYITDIDLPPNNEYTLYLSSVSNSFNISDNGVIATRLPLDFELNSEHNITVFAQDIHPPFFRTSLNILIMVINENDEMPIIQIDPFNSMFNYFEGHFNLAINPSIDIQDSDLPPLNVIASAYISLQVLDTSYNQEFVPNRETIPYPCLNEDRLLKARGCGIDNVELITTQNDGLVLFNGASLSGYSLSLESTQSQYAEFKDSISLGTEDSGLTISLWIWYQPLTDNLTCTILSKAAPNSGATNTVITLVCVNGDFHFVYNSFDGDKFIVLANVCSLLIDSWHHLAVVIDYNSSNWYFSLLIDGELVSIIPISAIRDQSGRLYLGAAPTPSNFNERQDYFNGFIHFLFFSNRVSPSTIYCSIGCGEALWFSDTDSDLSVLFSYNNGILSISGTSSELEYEELMNSLYYVNTIDEPQVLEQTIVYQVSDGVSNSLPVIVTITLVPLNDYPPDLNLGNADGNFQTIFVEGSNPVSLVDSANFSLTDRDSVAFSYIISVTILNPLQPVSEEILLVTNTSPHISYSYENFILKISGNSPIPEFALILSTVTYQNLAGELTGGSRTIEFLVDDNSERFSQTRYCIISLIPINDIPVISLSVTQISYSEGDPAIILSDEVSIIDNDDDTLSWARVEIRNRLDGENELLIGPSVEVEGIEVTTDFNSITGVLLLSGVAPLIIYENLISQIRYENIGRNSTDGIREVQYFVNDGKNDSNPASIFILYNSINNRPIIDLNGNLPGLNFEISFIEDTHTSILAVSPNLMIIDIDSPTLSWAQVVLKNPLAPVEYLSVSTENSQLISTYDNATYVLTISPYSLSQTSISEFVTVLRTVTYNNPSEEPTPISRTICFTVSDGQLESSASNTSITIIPVNDIPSIDLDTSAPGNNYTTSYTEGGPPIYITSRNVSVIDNDNNRFVSLFIRITSNTTLSSGEEILTSHTNLTVPDPIFIASENVVQYSINFDGILNVNVVLQSLTYSNLLSEPRGTIRILELYVFDGTDFSPSVFTQIQIFLTNAQSPVFLRVFYRFNVSENSIVPTLIGNVSAQDSDSGIDGEIYYALTSSGDFTINEFFISSETGEIYSNISFDRESIDFFSFFVYAFDSGQPQRSSIANVTVIVIDENEFSPTIQPNISLTFFVLEEQLPPISIGVIIATDDDAGENAEIHFLIVGGDGLNLFSISDSGEISTNSTFDREENDDYDLIISISDQGTPPLSSQITISVVILDINDNGPIFMPSLVSVNFPENLPNSYVLTLKATDNDIALNSVVIYQLLGSDQFTIDENTGDIYTGPDGLDRETVAVHNLVGLAIDFGGFNGTQGFTGFVTVMIVVLDENDNPPSFNQSSYSAFVPENSPLNTSVITLQATDLDAGINKIVRYVVSSPENVPFLIDAVSGSITVSGSIDHEFVPQYGLDVIAYDLGNSSLNSSVIVTIDVNDTNDNFPLFSEPNFFAELSENTISSNIITITASDRDSTSNSEISYALLNFQSLFSIHPKLGLIYNIVPLDYEFTCEYILLISATDNGLPQLSSTTTVTISISNLEDVFPQFTTSNFFASASENEPMSVILVLTADDLDGTCPNKSRVRTSDLIYSIISSTGPFSLSLSGELSAAELDRESIDLHFLNVSVSDSVGLTDFASVTVTVLDVNDNTPRFPNDINIFVFNVSEAAPSGFVVATIPVFDVDTIDEGRLVFSLKIPYSSNFTINSTGHIIIEFLDIESGILAISLFEVRDSLNHSISGVVFIFIQDADDNPPELFGIFPIVNFTEGSETLDIFSNLVILDKDINFQYLSSARLLLSSPESFNSTLPDMCICDVGTCHPGCLEYLTIEQSSSNSDVSIVHQLGSKYLTIMGIESIGYYISLLRTVSYVNTINNPIPTPRTITLIVSDVGDHSTQGSISLELIVLNQFPPLLDLDGFDTISRNFETTFIENGNAIAIVGPDISFMDPDRGTTTVSRLRVTIRDPIDQPEEYLFISPMKFPQSISIISSNTSLLLVGPGSHLDFISILLAVKYINIAAEPDLHTRVVTFDFEDGHLNGATVTTLIRISGINDFPPNISPDTFFTQFIEEGISVPIVPSDIKIIDQDSFPPSNVELLIEIVNLFDVGGDIIQFSSEFSLPDGINMVNFSDVKVMFYGNVSLDSFQYILLNLRYSYQLPEFIDLSTRLVILSISDDPNTIGFFTATTDVELIAINDQHPSIQLISPIEVFEDESVGEILLQILFTDGDTHSTSIPHFYLQDTFNQTFSIDNNGLLFISSNLDFETVPYYSLVVSVLDTSIVVNSSISFTQINITVIDVNDNSPVFDPNNYTITIGEDLPINSVVLTLQASDLDTGINSELIFQLLGVSDFSLDSVSGHLSIVTPLNFNRQQIYFLTAIVTNPTGSFLDSASIRIHVLDVNNNPPILSIAPLSLPFIDGQENLNFQLFIFNITDPDPNPTLDSAAISIQSSDEVFDYLSLDSSLTELSVSGSSTKSIQITGTAPTSIYRDLFSNLVYTDTASEPLDNNRSISFILQDSTGPFSSNIVTLSFIPQYINDNIPILNISGSSSPFLTDFIENGNPISVASTNLSISDADIGSSPRIQGATVYISDPLDFNAELSTTEEYLTFSLLSPSIEVNSSLRLRHPQNFNISRYIRLEFSGTASIDIYQGLLRSIRYSNDAEQPNGLGRTIAFYVYDDIFTSEVMTSFVSFVFINDIPIISPDQKFSYSEGQGNLLLWLNLLIRDADDATLRFVSITHSVKSQISLTYNFSLFLINETSTIITLSAHPDSPDISIESYLNVLRSTTYSNNRLTPTDTPIESIELLVTDSQDGVSESHITLICFSDVDTPPVLDLNGPNIPSSNFNATFYENSAPIMVVSDNATLIDLDSIYLSSVLLEISGVSDGEFETLLFSHSELITVTMGRNLSSVSYQLIGNTTLINYLNFLKEIKYENTQNEPTPGTRILSIQAFNKELDMPKMSSNKAYTNIEVINLNDNPPIFSQDKYIGYINETDEIGIQPILQVFGDDMDLFTFTELVFSLSITSPFRINEITGEIFSTLMLDAEFIQEYRFEVFVTDSDPINPLISSAQVDIIVLDENDNQPIFSETSFTVQVSENVPIGYTVRVVNATDADSGNRGEIQYSLASSPGSSLPFQISIQSGVVSTTQVLDREDTSFYNFTIIASDLGSPSLSSLVSILILLTDVNDNFPRFNLPPSADHFTFEVLENASPQSVIGSITASDRDFGANGLLSYQLFSNIFSLHPSTGELTITRSLDFENKTRFDLIVFAKDSGTPPLTSNISLVILVLPANDNAPLFTQDEFSFQQLENSNFSQIFFATDADNDVLRYSLVEPVFPFLLDTRTGLIRSRQPLDYEDEIFYNLSLQVTDGVFTSHAQVLIYVINENDNAPSFPSNFSVTVSENTELGTELLQVTAVDPDPGISGISYFIDDPIANRYFSVDSVNGSLTLEQMFDFEIVSSVVFLIFAVDGGILQLTGETTISIQITDADDNPPLVISLVSEFLFTEEGAELELGSTIEVIDNDTHPLSETLIRISIPTCILSDEELQMSCENIQLCVDQCGERIEVTVARNYNISLNYIVEQGYHTIILSGLSTPEIYQSILNTLRYINTQPEPLANERMVEITVRDSLLYSEPLLLTISISLLNDNCPIISLSKSTLNFSEGSEPLMVGSEAGLLLQDDDFQLASSINSISRVLLQLNGIESEMEGLEINNTSTLVFTRNLDHPLTLNSDSVQIYTLYGPSDPFTYTTVLARLKYFNRIEEPILTDRSLAIMVYDESNNTIDCISQVQITISVFGTNDNSPIIIIPNSNFEYEEESGILRLGAVSGIYVQDSDHEQDNILTFLTLRLSPVQDGDQEKIELNTSQSFLGIDIIESSHMLILIGPSPLSSFNSLLSTLTYTNSAPEPAYPVLTRILSVNVNDGAFPSSNMISISLQLLNDNLISLSLLLDSFVFVEGTSSLPIGSLTSISLSDEDKDSYVSSIRISLIDYQEPSQEVLMLETPEEIFLSNFSNPIRVDRISTLVEAEDILKSLKYIYSTSDEPLPGLRMISISLEDSGSQEMMATTTILINVTVINNNPPLIQLTNGVLHFTEGHMNNTLNVGTLSGIALSDDDNNAIFPLQSANISLSGDSDMPYESLSLDYDKLVRNDIQILNTSSQVDLFLSGTSNLTNYQSILSSVVYRNERFEPSPTNRTITFVVSDGSFDSNIPSLIIVISLVNDNPLVISCNLSFFYYNENIDSNGILIASLLTLYDGDADHIITSASIRFANYSLSDQIQLNESVNSSFNIVSTRNTILIQGEGSSEEYSKILTTLSYNLVNPEPDLFQQTVVIEVQSILSNVSCLVTVIVIDDNDNVPILDLDRNEPGTDFNTDIIYEAFTSQSVNIAPDSFIMDEDFSAYTHTLEVELNESRPNDRLHISFCPLLNSTPFFYQIGYSRNEFTCDPISNASIKTEFTIAHFSTFRTLTISQPSIRLSNQLFSHILQSLQLLTDPTRPVSPLFTSRISLRAFDGRFYSNSAQSSINLSFTNLQPVLFISPLFTPVLEESTTPSITIFSPDFPPLLSDDSGRLQRVIIMLVNSPDGVDEKLTFNPLESDVIRSTPELMPLTLEGPATTEQFISALTRVFYSNSKLANILLFSPDLSERTVTLQAVDTEEGISNTSSMKISFFANCKNGLNIVKIPSMYSILRLSLCERLQADLEISGEIESSLSPLNGLRVINGSLVLREIQQLKSLAGLENLEFFRSISIIQMPDLVSTSELGRNIASDEMLTIEGISVIGNLELLNVSGFKHIQIVNGPVVIAYNSKLSDLSGLNEIVMIDELYLISNLNLEDINGFTRIQSVTNSIYLNLNSDLLQITGFSSLSSVGGRLSIIGNSQIVSVDGLASLQTANSIVITSNNQLCYIGGDIITNSLFENVSTDNIIMDENLCFQRNCTSVPCLGGGSCKNLPVGGFECTCATGLTGDRCQFENECITMLPCENRATCVDSEQGYTCSCMEGYTGDQCQININDCNDQTCLNKGTCIDMINSYTCECPGRFTGSTCETEILHCTSSPCFNGGACSETTNGYICMCAPGYTGTECELDVNECNYLPCVNGGTCVNMNGSFNCNCSHGFNGSLCEEDIDECLVQPCKDESICINTKGSFVCMCPPEFEGPLCQRIVHPCTFIPCKNGQCIEADSSYECQCNHGYTGQNCDVRIDNCENVACLNGGICMNGPDYYSCNCLPGYFGDNCELSNACISSPCLFEGECFALDSEYACQCLDGFSGTRCQDVESFASKLSVCGLLNIMQLSSATNQTDFLSLNGNQVISSADTICLFSPGIVFSTWLWQEFDNDGVLFSFNTDSDIVLELRSLGSLDQLILRYSHPVVAPDNALSLSSRNPIIFRNVSLADTVWHAILLIISPTAIELHVDGIYCKSEEIPPPEILTTLKGNYYIGGTREEGNFNGLLSNPIVAILDNQNSNISSDLYSCITSCPLENPCQNGGVCSSSTSSILFCQCPDQYEGARCLDKITAFTLISDSSIELQVTEEITIIQLEIRPLTKSGGLLYYSDAIRIRFDADQALVADLFFCAAESVTLYVTYENSLVSDWSDLSIYLNINQSLIIRVDNTSTSFSLPNRLCTSSSGTIYIGSTKNTSPSMSGCVRNLRINNSPLSDNSMPILKSVQYGCAHSTVQLYGYSFISFESLPSAPSFSLSLEISHQLANSRLAYLTRTAFSTELQETFSLKIYEESVLLSYSGNNNISLSTRSAINLDLMWHTIELEFDETSLSISLTVDGSNSVLLLTATQIFDSSKLVLGDELVQTGILDEQVFSGCIRDVVWNSALIDLQQHSEAYHVHFNTCSY
ncbi:protocadherin Fat 4-like [Oopsacas minuta]|uniref:Protocadherin Fat 4-like n=1 Tax=Oopsacas minuta TaxID=111878 RepID=A0AAV7JQY9_9METZ|nr:protocadherin Fat 4-like [Oopsacas minuta]